MASAAHEEHRAVTLAENSAPSTFNSGCIGDGVGVGVGVGVGDDDVSSTGVAVWDAPLTVKPARAGTVA